MIFVINFLLPILIIRLELEYVALRSWPAIASDDSGLETTIPSYLDLETIDWPNGCSEPGCCCFKIEIQLENIGTIVTIVLYRKAAVLPTVIKSIHIRCFSPYSIPNPL